MGVTTTTRPPGRPRSDEARCAILKSTLELLDEVGFTTLSIEAIAARAGVSKATVYRWWKNKAQLVVEAFLTTVGPELRFPPEEPFDIALRNQMLRVARVFSGHMGSVIAAIIGAGQSEPEMLSAFHDVWIEPRRTEARKLLKDAMESRRVRNDVSPDTILDLLYGALYFRLLIRKRPLDPTFVNSIANIVMDGSICQRNGSGRKKSHS
jgi:AcrR family transcriptional regulator